MPPPSKLAVATSSLVRLVKEEASYYKEMEQQEARIKKLEAGSDDENADYLLKQERQGLQETRNVLPTVRTKISDALEQLEARLESNKEAGDVSPEEIIKAEEAIEKARIALRDEAR